MERASTSRLTPWVGRLLMFNTAVALLLATVFTHPRFPSYFELDPRTALTHPWTFFTYPFVHTGLVHFLLTSIVLFVLGPPVERKLGGRRFIGYYFYCAVGTALLAAGLATTTGLRVEPFVGASAPLFGIALAFVIHWPAAEVSSLPLPAPLTARTVFGVILAVDVIGALAVGTTSKSTGIAHLAHLGGVLAGYLFFRIQSLAARRPPPRPTAVIRRPVVTPMRVQETVNELRPATPTIERLPSAEHSDAEVDRVLDKIARFGIQSLTSQERQFLAEVSERKRKEHD